MIASDGLVAANYRKTHLYGAAERRNYSFGQDLPPVVDLNGVAVGVLNCYECEFPPLYQYLAEQGATIVLGPTAADGHKAAPRDKAVRSSRLAEARLAGGDLDGALDAANCGAGLLEDKVSSVRALDRLKEFSARLEPHRSVPAIREFRERLHALPVTA